MNKYFKSLSGILIVTFLVASSFLLFPKYARAAISNDTFVDGSNVATQTNSHSHTLAANATLLVAEVLFSNNTTSQSITYGGVAPSGSITQGSANGLYTYHLFWWFNPPTGANTLLSTLNAAPSAAHVLRSASYIGVAAIAPATDLTPTSAPTVTFTTDALTPTNPNSWIIGIVENSAVASSAGVNTVFRAGNGNGDGIYDSNAAVSVATSLQGVGSGSVPWTAALAAFSPIVPVSTNNPNLVIDGGRQVIDGGRQVIE